MLKLNIIVLIVGCLILTTINAQNYIPPSDDELWLWFESLTQEEKIAEIKKLDVIENTIPKLTFPSYSAVLTKSGDLIIFPINSIATIEIDYLCYEINLPEYKINNFYIKEKKDFIDYIKSPVIGMGIGIIGAAIAKSKDPWQYIVSASQGVIFGFVITLIY